MESLTTPSDEMQPSSFKLPQYSHATDPEPPSSSHTLNSNNTDPTGSSFYQSQPGLDEDEGIISHSPFCQTSLPHYLIPYISLLNPAKPIVMEEIPILLPPPAFAPLAQVSANRATAPNVAAKKAIKSCHNCRRQRLRCDRTEPHCNKCLRAGRDCLGYGQLFRWTDSVATRGILAGQTSSQAVYEKASLGAATVTRRAKPKYLLMGQNTVADDSSSGSGTEFSASEDGTGQVNPMSRKRAATTPCCDASTPESPTWGLTDPMYQDLKPTDRFYLSYFANRFCQDLVSLDIPTQNPFRELMPLAQSHPLLQNVLIANAATHMSNVTNAFIPILETIEIPTRARSRGSNSPDSTPSPTGRGGGASFTILPPVRRGHSEAMMRDALVAKQKALNLMRTALQDMENWNSDVVFAAAYCFVNLELTESGKTGWKAHLEGTVRLMGLLNQSKSSTGKLRDYMLSDCAVYLILASAFLPVNSDTADLYQPSEMRALIERAAENCYVSCPPEVLEILHHASILSRTAANVTDPAQAAEIASAGAALIHRAQYVDMVPWARLRSSHYQQHEGEGPPHSEMGIHVGKAHCLASCLYILQAVPQVVELGEVDANLEERIALELLDEMACVGETDANFKGTTWPLFILGAAATDPEVRDWVMGRMRLMVTVVPWGFLYTAMETLEVLWKHEEEEGKDNQYGNVDEGVAMETDSPQVRPLPSSPSSFRKTGRSWVQKLRDPELNFLIV